MRIPQLILKQLHTFGTLTRTGQGVTVGMKNRLSDATLIGIHSLAVDGVPVPLDAVRLEGGNDAARKADEISSLDWVSSHEKYGRNR